MHCLLFQLPQLVLLLLLRAVRRPRCGFTVHRWVLVSQVLVGHVLVSRAVVDKSLLLLLLLLLAVRRSHCGFTVHRWRVFVSRAAVDRLSWFCHLSVTARS